MESTGPQPAESLETNASAPGDSAASSTSPMAPSGHADATVEDKAPFAEMKKMGSVMLKGWENYWEKQVDQARPLLPSFVLPYLPPKPGEADDPAGVRVIRAPSNDTSLGKGEFTDDKVAQVTESIDDDAVVEPAVEIIPTADSLNDDEETQVPPEGKARYPSPRPDRPRGDYSPSKQDNDGDSPSRMASQCSLGEPEHPAFRPPSSKPGIIAEPSSRSGSNFQQEAESSPHCNKEVVEPGMAKKLSESAPGQEHAEPSAATVAAGTAPGAYTAEAGAVSTPEQAGDMSVPEDKRGEIHRSLGGLWSFVKRPGKSEFDTKKVEASTSEDAATAGIRDAAATSGPTGFGAALPGSGGSLTEVADPQDPQRAGSSVASAGGRAAGPFQGSSVASVASVDSVGNIAILHHGQNGAPPPTPACSDADVLERPLTAFAEQLAVTTLTSAERLASRICEQFQQYCLDEAGMGLHSCTSDVPLPGKRNMMSQVAREFASQVERLGFEKMEWWTGKNWREAQGRFHILHDNVYDKYYMRLKVTWLTRPPQDMQAPEREMTHLSSLEQLQQTLELQRQFLERALEAQISTISLTAANAEHLKQLRLSIKER